MAGDSDTSSAFDEARRPRIVVGAGRRARLGTELAHLGVAGGPLLLVCDGAVGDAVDEVQATLSEGATALKVIENGAGEPHLEAIERAAAAAQPCVAVVALGGGSALDTGKLAACHADAPTAIRAHALGARPLPERRRALICLPSTAGTGAEVTSTAVFTANGTKLWSWGDPLRPDLAVLDPELTVGLPAAVTAMTGLDALVHAIEAATIHAANASSRDDGLRAMRLVRKWLKRAVEAPEDIRARRAMQIAACRAGFAIDASGTGAAHAFGHGLANLGAIPHGRAVALALRVVLPWNAAADPARYAEVAQALGVVEPVASPDFAAALGQRYDVLLRDVGLELDLRGDGMRPDQAARLAAAAMAPENRPMMAANSRALEPADARQLAEAILPR